MISYKEKVDKMLHNVETWEQVSRRREGGGGMTVNATKHVSCMEFLTTKTDVFAVI